MLVLLTAVFATAAHAQTPPPPPANADEDSLRISIEMRLDRLGAIRDSLRREADLLRAESGAMPEEPDEREIDLSSEVARALALADSDSVLTLEFRELGDAIANFGRDLQDMELELGDRAIQLRGPGGDFQIDIPEDLGERISKGLASITTNILAELPDTLDFEEKLRDIEDLGRDWDEVSRHWDDSGRKKRQPEYKIVGQDIVVFDSDVEVYADEKVNGSVMAVLGDVEVSGLVDGDVVAIGGSIKLYDNAEVNGNVVSVFGEVERDDSVVIHGRVTSIDLSGVSGFDLPHRIQRGPAGFFAKSSLLIVLGLFVLLMFAVLPRARLMRILDNLRASPRRALGVGLLWTIVGHVALAVLVALLVVTIIGIPLALLLLLAYMILGLVAVGAVSRVVGELVLSRRGVADSSEWMGMVIGLLVISLPTVAGLILSPLPLIGWIGRLLELVGLIVHFLVYCYGAGAIFASRFGSGRLGA